MSCRCSDPKYLIMTRSLLADFERNAARREREDIIAYINELAIEWERPTAINVRQTIFDIGSLIKEKAHNG